MCTFEVGLYGSTEFFEKYGPSGINYEDGLPVRPESPDNNSMPPCTRYDEEGTDNARVRNCLLWAMGKAGVSWNGIMTIEALHDYKGMLHVVSRYWDGPLFEALAEAWEVVGIESKENVEFLHPQSRRWEAIRWEEAIKSYSRLPSVGITTGKN